MALEAFYDRRIIIAGASAVPVKTVCALVMDLVGCFVYT
jgi:hypothetical protein